VSNGGISDTRKQRLDAANAPATAPDNGMAARVIPALLVTILPGEVSTAPLLAKGCPIT
jgi:hypothetical protein